MHWCVTKLGPNVAKPHESWRFVLLGFLNSCWMTLQTLLAALPGLLKCFPAAPDTKR